MFAKFSKGEHKQNIQRTYIEHLFSTASVESYRNLIEILGDHVFGKKLTSKLTFALAG
jgi:hypothetical protein